jgi:hypothetical protein
MSEPTAPTMFLAALPDVDGVLPASPLERAWRETFSDFARPAAIQTESVSLGNVG